MSSYMHNRRTFPEQRLSSLLSHRLPANTNLENSPLLSSIISKQIYPPSSTVSIFKDVQSSPIKKKYTSQSSRVRKSSPSTLKNNYYYKAENIQTELNHLSSQSFLKSHQSAFQCINYTQSHPNTPIKGSPLMKQQTQIIEPPPNFLVQSISLQGLQNQKIQQTNFDRIGSTSMKSTRNFTSSSIRDIKTSSINQINDQYLFFQTATSFQRLASKSPSQTKQQNFLKDFVSTKPPSLQQSTVTSPQLEKNAKISNYFQTKKSAQKQFFSSKELKKQNLHKKPAFKSLYQYRARFPQQLVFSQQQALSQYLDSKNSGRDTFQSYSATLSNTATQLNTVATQSNTATQVNEQDLDFQQQTISLNSYQTNQERRSQDLPLKNIRKRIQSYQNDSQQKEVRQNMEIIPKHRIVQSMISAPIFLDSPEQGELLSLQQEQANNFYNVLVES